MAAGVNALVFLAISLQAGMTDQDVEVIFSTTKPLTTVDDHFVGVTIDAGLLPISANLSGLDLSSPKVQLLAKAISPCYLRIGGTTGDINTFDPTGKRGGRRNETFTGSTWDNLNNFVKTVGWDLIFGLNVLKRRGLEWDPTNAVELINYSLKRKYSFAGLELGNEPQFFPGPMRGKISGGQLGRDFMTLKNIIRSTPGLNSTLLIGPDSQGLTAGSDNMFKEFFAGIGSKAVDRITVHQYYGFEARATVDKCMEPATMDALIGTINTVYKVTKKSNPNTPVWLGETSSFWGGGAANISNSYVAGFLWLDKLGLAAKMGFKGVLRQSFYGQNYSLIDMNTNDFHPFPDYWLTLLYKRLVGNKVLNLTTNAKEDLRIYAHCTNHKNPYGYPPGSVTAYYINVQKTEPTALIEFPQFLGQTLRLFSLIPAYLDPTDKYVALNGKKIELVDNKIPDLEPDKTPHNFVLIGSSTFGFIVIPDANLEICKT